MEANNDNDNDNALEPHRPRNTIFDSPFNIVDQLRRQVYAISGERKVRETSTFRPTMFNFRHTIHHVVANMLENLDYKRLGTVGKRPTSSQRDCSQKV